MTTIVIPRANWEQRLHQAIHNVQDGQTIRVPHEEARAIALAELKKRKPDVFVFVEVKE